MSTMAPTRKAQGKTKRRLYQDSGSETKQDCNEQDSTARCEHLPRASKALVEKSPQEKTGVGTVTPLKDERAGATASFFTPKVKKRKKATNDAKPKTTHVTPSPVVSRARRGLVLEAAVRGEKKTSQQPRPEQFVPVHVHRNLEYLRSGQATISEGKKKAYEFIIQHCVIPENFENDRRFGPLSGSCHEDRVIAAFTVGRLRSKPGDRHAEAVAAGVCSNCGGVGHRRINCASLI